MSNSPAELINELFELCWVYLIDYPGTDPMTKHAKIIIAVLAIYSAVLTAKLGIFPPAAQAAFGGGDVIPLQTGDQGTYFIKDDSVYFCIGFSKCASIHKF